MKNRQKNKNIHKLFLREVLNSWTAGCQLIAIGFAKINLRNCKSERDVRKEVKRAFNK